MITYIVMNMHCKRVQNSIYKASVQRAHDAPTTHPRHSKRPTALPQRAHSALSNTLYKREARFEHVQNKRYRMAF